MVRPGICPDRSCQVIASSFNAEFYERGYSFHCVGKLPSMHTMSWRDAVHNNEYCLCIASPMKGIIKFLVSESDCSRLADDLGKVGSLAAGKGNVLRGGKT